MSVSLLLPPGTQVVARKAVRVVETGAEQPAGAVGFIVKTPADATESYRVRFPDGGEASLRREEFSILKSIKDGALRTGALDINWEQFVIYRCIVGSRAYGLDDETSDTDRRGFFLPSAELDWSLYGVPEQLENHETQETYWEIQKFIRLALKADPNILECLHSPLVELATEIAERLLSIRDVFLSQLAYQTYNGYVLSQFRKLEQDLRARGAIKWKHAMHLVRLLLSGITILREGRVTVRVSEHRDRLLAIRRGELTWEEVNAWRFDLHREFDDAFTKTSLPKQPDYDRANAFLIEARRSMVSR